MNPRDVFKLEKIVLKDNKNINKYENKNWKYLAKIKEVII